MKDSKRGALWSLNEAILKITIMKTNTPYPSRKIRRIRACTHKRPQRIKLNTPYQERLNTPYSRYGMNIIFWKISNVVPTLRNPQYAEDDYPTRLIEEYIKFEEEKARRHGRVFNWQTATYGKVRVNDDLYDALPCKSKSFEDMALPPCEQRHRFLRYDGVRYSDADIADFEGRLARIYRREVHRVPVFDFGGLPDMMAEGLSVRMLMEHKDDQRVSLFTSRAWRRLFDIRGPLVHELILEFCSTFRFGQAILDLDTSGALQFQLGGAKRRMSWREFILALGLYTAEEMQTVRFGAYWADSARQIPDKGDLRDYWIGISTAGDFLSTTPSYTTIRDPILRLCHRLIACSVAGGSQAPEKVTVTDLFYLRGMDIDSVNAPYLLARYLRLFAAGRKSRAHISGGQFICTQFDDTWAWVAMGPERQADVAAGAPDEDVPAVDEGDHAVLAPMQAPQQPPPPQLLLGLCPIDWGDLRRRYMDCVGMSGVYTDL
ncbi:hypothetical protein Tco_1230277 [Tanacetum coccineum]